MLYTIGGLFIICGLIFKIVPPKKINNMWGYRTKFSMINQDTWNEAHKYSANSFIIIGFSYIALGFILNQLIKVGSDYNQVIIFLIGAVIMILVDELHLRRTFTNDGSRKL
ncbi:SdpI family protein [Clostridium estertheticum]|uniref:SdpI family protein n=1 Tax=Clostridium estertheticum TaxID=238834 RepID=UPI0013E90066|nr:SdpI family protein [Clostridium estertheticum]MBZ9686067.1 SdpI family protein [Clostridium estertheticum]